MGILEKIFGPPNIETLKQKRDLNGLIRALNHKELSIRNDAAEALGDIGDPRAVDPLITALKDEDASVRQAVVEALVRIGSAAVEPLIAAFKDAEEARQPIESVRKFIPDLQGSKGKKLMERLLTPDKGYHGKFQFLLDNGTYEEAEYGRYQYYRFRGPGKGGIRYANYVSESLEKLLAFLMGITNILIGNPYGGGKGGIKFNRHPKEYSPNELQRATRAYVRSLLLGDSDSIGPENDVPAPDVGTGPREMAWMMDEYIRIRLDRGEIKDERMHQALRKRFELELNPLNVRRVYNQKRDASYNPVYEAYLEIWNDNPEMVPYELAFITGKPVEIVARNGRKLRAGGTLGRAGATGLGVTFVAEKAVAEILKKPFDQTTFALQGFGNVGSYSAFHVWKRGGKVTLITDWIGVDLEGLRNLLKGEKSIYDEIKEHFLEKLSSLGSEDLAEESPFMVTSRTVLKGILKEEDAQKIKELLRQNERLDNFVKENFQLYIVLEEREKGLPVDHLLDYANKNKTLKGFNWEGVNVRYVNGEESLRSFVSSQVDVLIPAALEGQITEENAHLVEASLIIEGANGPTTAGGHKVLESRKEKPVHVIVDVLANSGGVRVSYFEWYQNIYNELWSEETVNQKLEVDIKEAFDKVYRLANQMGVSFRQAAYILAIKELIKGLQNESIKGLQKESYEPQTVGVIKEIKTDEQRVGLTPRGVKQMSDLGFEVVVQKEAGVRSGFKDWEYLEAGAILVDRAEEIFERASIIKHVNELQPSEYELLKPSHLVFTYNHFEDDRKLTERSMQSGATFVSYEKVVVDGKTPLLAPMSRIAGLLAVEWADVVGKRVVILGGGAAGESAAERALKGGALEVVVTEYSAKRREELKDKYPQLKVAYSEYFDVVEKVLKDADVIIGAVYRKGKAPILIGYSGQMDEREGKPVPYSFEQIVVASGKPKVIVDISVDQGGNIAYVTDRQLMTVSHEKTSHTNKFVVDAYGNKIARVPNMPAAMPRQASKDLEKATLPYLIALAKGLERALKEKPELKGGVSIRSGKVLDSEILRAHSVVQVHTPG